MSKEEVEALIYRFDIGGAGKALELRAFEDAYVDWKRRADDREGRGRQPYLKFQSYCAGEEDTRALSRHLKAAVEKYHQELHDIVEKLNQRYSGNVSSWVKSAQRASRSSKSGKGPRDDELDRDQFDAALADLEIPQQTRARWRARGNDELFDALLARDERYVLVADLQDIISSVKASA